MGINFRGLVAGVALCGAAPGFAVAAEIMPSFVGAPTGWSVDRYAPNSFSDVGTFQGRSDVLGISISSADGFNNRAPQYQSTFYNTQGMSHPISGGIGDSLSADLYIDAAWLNGALGTIRTDMWGVVDDVSNNIVGYPIIGFTNVGGTGHFQAWDDQLSQWDALGATVNVGWNELSFTLGSGNVNYFVNGTLQATIAGDPTADHFERTIMQAYNFGDPSLSGVTPVDYTAHWSAAVPEPSTWAMLLMGFGVVGFMMRRARREGAVLTA